ncbi:MAG: ABC transporter permease [Eubacterium sp.]|nr:ABC transporter permease [Eubacterium sp.]
MGIWKRAYLYIKRKKTRSIKLFLIFFLTGILLLTGLSVRRGAAEEAGKIRSSLAAGLTLICKPMDPYKMFDISTNEKGETVFLHKLPLVTENRIEELLAVDGISGFFSDLESKKAYTEHTLVPGVDSQALDILEGRASEEYPGQRELLEEYQEYSRIGAHMVSVVGVYDSQWHPAFVNGAVELVKGQHVGLKDRKKAVISDQLAEKNGFVIGDHLKIQCIEEVDCAWYGSIYEAEIAGIFHMNFEQPVGEYTKEPQLLANVIFCTTDMSDWYTHEEQVYFEKEITALESEHHLETMVLFVEDPALLDSVKEQLLQIDSIDWEYYDTRVYDKDYQTAAAPLLMMIKFSDVLIAAVIFLAFLFLLKCLMVWTRSRKRETGILFLNGIKRKDMLLQFILECCCMAAAAFPAAAFLAGPLSGFLGNGLWTLLFSAANTRGYEVITDGFGSGIEVNMLPVKGDALSYVLTPEMLSGVFLVLVGMSAAAVLVSSKEIWKWKTTELLERR